MLSDNLAPQPMTDVFTNDTNIDRRKCHRTVPMKVLALGVGRTGTACEFVLRWTDGLYTPGLIGIETLKLKRILIDSSPQGL